MPNKKSTFADKMANDYFQFKQFTVFHQLCAMKVGTDGVLLGAWAGTEDTRRILDVGTGSGLIALMLAQRSEAHIDAIDIHPDAVRQARYNVENSRFSDRISVFHTAIQDYQPEHKYDMICCNPPFFKHSLKGPDQSRNIARHSDSLPFEVLTSKSTSLLKKGGKLCVILPSDVFSCFHDKACQNELVLTEKTVVRAKPLHPPKRVLATYCLLPDESFKLFESELTIELDRHLYSEEYIRLTQAFYLKM